MPPTAQAASLGIYINFDLWEQDTLRKRVSFFDHIEARLLKKAFPSQFGVRGNFVGSDSLIEAIVREGRLERCELFSHPLSIPKLRHRLLTLWNARESRVGFNPYDALLTNLDRFSLAALVAPKIGSGELFLLRDRSSFPNLPIICLNHGYSLHPLLYDMFLRILLSNVAPFDSLICTSHASLTAMRSIFERVSACFNRRYGCNLKFSGRFDIIPLCVDTETLKPQDRLQSRRHFRIPKDAFVMLFFGRISPLKADLIPLLSVFGSLVRDNRDRQLLLVLAGSEEHPYAGFLEEFVNEQGLSKHVRIVGDIPDHLKASLLCSADVFVAIADSIQESFGLTPVEAMACGIPQVAADWNGYRDTVVHGETGFLIPTYWTECDRDLTVTGPLFGWPVDHLAIGQSVAMDLSSLRLFLQTLIDKEELRRTMAERSRERASSLYSFRAVAKQYEDLAVELFSISAGTDFHKRTETFETPEYFKSFRGHARHIIEDQSVLGLSTFGKERHSRWLLDSLCRSADPPLGARRNLVLAALGELGYSDCQPGFGASVSKNLLPFGELVQRVGKIHLDPPDLIRRSVMWLIKHGFVIVTCVDGKALEIR